MIPFNKEWIKKQSPEFNYVLGKIFDEISMGSFIKNDNATVWVSFNAEFEVKLTSMGFKVETKSVSGRHYTVIYL
jgi:hypothetical protein